MSVTVRAAAIMCFAMCLPPVGDTAGKVMAEQGVAPAFVAWSRFCIGLLVLLPFLGRGSSILRLMRNWRVWLRGALIALGILCILTSAKTEPIATVFAAFFIGPILSYFLSALLLGERITRPRTVLLFCGFVGVLMVVQPFGGAGLGILWAVLAGMFYGSFLVASRWLADLGSSRDLMMSQLVVGALLLMPIGATQVPEFSTAVAGLTLLSGLTSLGGNLLLLVAYRMIDAAKLAPLVYVQLISATVLSVVVFNDIPNGLALVGLVVLLASGFGSFLVRQGSR